MNKLLLAFAFAATTAFAQDTRPIRMLVGFPPGGSTDIVARIMSDKLREALGRPVIVDNRPGAGGQVAAVALKNATPDGTTVMMTIDHTHVIIPLTFKEPGYDPLKDFTPITGVAQYFNAMAVSSKTGANNLKELAAWIRLVRYTASMTRTSCIGIVEPPLRRQVKCFLLHRPNHDFGGAASE